MKSSALIAILGALCTASALAQTAATVPTTSFYGLVDVGPSYYSNTTTAGGQSGKAVLLDSGIAAGNRFGWNASLGLDNGLSAITTLEGGFTVADGTSAQGGVLFGRQLFAGLKNAYGALTFGRQYDFMFDYLNLGGYTSAGHDQIGALGQGLDGASMVITSPATLATATGTLGNHTYGARINSSMKFSSASFQGFSVGALVGLGNVPGNQQRGRTTSLGLNYAGSPFSAGIANVRTNQAANGAETSMWGAGAKYVLGSTTLYGSYTDVKYTGVVAGWNQPRLKTAGLGFDCQIDPRWAAGLAYQNQSRNAGKGGANQFTGSIAYRAASSTWLYLAGALAKDHAFGATAVFGAGGPSATSSQDVLRVAVRQGF